MELAAEGVDWDGFNGEFNACVWIKDLSQILSVEVCVVLSDISVNTFGEQLIS